MLRWLFSCVGLLVLLLATGCLKELDFALGEQENELVVYGILTDQPGRHRVNITRTNPFETQVAPAPVSGAVLTLEDGQSRQYPFVEIEPGVYQLADTLFKAEAGERYALEVRLADGQAYRSEWGLTPKRVKPDSAYAGRVERERKTQLELYIDVPIPADPTGVFLRWEVTRVWRRTSVDLATVFQDYFRFRAPKVCYMTEAPNPNDLQLFGSKRQGDFSLRRQAILNLPLDEKFFERNVFQVLQYRITEEAFNYWNDIKRVNNPEGTIFDPPPATVRGNIYSKQDPQVRILGFFEVAAVDTVYTSVTSSLFLPTFVPDPCFRDFNRLEWAETYFYRPTCAFCTNIEGHSLEKPKFW